MNYTEAKNIEARFVELMTNLFQIDVANTLDFGIYRVIRRLNREVTDFFGEVLTHDGTKVVHGGKLASMLDAAFAAIGDAEGEKLRLGELERQLGLAASMTRSERENLLAQAESIPAVAKIAAEYRACIDRASDQSGIQHDRAEVLNRLLQFFSLHYQEGDFIVERRYGKDGARYIKSIGEDTEYRWATEGMYYIKSGDIFTDFPTRLSTGKLLRFGVSAEGLESTRAQLRPNDKAHYELDDVRRDEGTITVNLRYKKGAQTEQQRLEILEAVEHASGCHVSELRRALARFIARNQSDFFIHRNLYTALADDLDIFIKTDVLDVGQLLAASRLPSDLPRRAMKVAHVLHTVGMQIIDFLGAAEDFKKALWEKKKVVLESNYIITLDRLAKYAPSFLGENFKLILQSQRDAWRELGLGDFKTASDCVRPGPGLGEVDAKYFPLPVDTRKLGPEFKWSMLDAVTRSVALDDALDGTAIKSDNWQALNTLEHKYADLVKCVYIDPPYNTDASGIPYKNGYRHASWAALMENRTEKLHRFLSSDGAIFVSINEIERTSLEQVLSRVFGAKNRVEELVWIQNTNDGKSPTYSTNHEYVEVFAKQKAVVEADRAMFREPKPGYEEVMELVGTLNLRYPPVVEIEEALRDLYAQHKAAYRQEIEALGLDWKVEKGNDPWKGIFNYKRAEYRDSQGRLVSADDAQRLGATIWVWRESDWTIMMSEGKQSDSISDPNDPNYRFYPVIHPVTGKPCAMPTRGWKGTRFIDPSRPSRISFESLVADNRIEFGIEG